MRWLVLIVVLFAVGAIACVDRETPMESDVNPVSQGVNGAATTWHVYTDSEFDYAMRHNGQFTTLYVYGESDSTTGLYSINDSIGGTVWWSDFWQFPNINGVHFQGITNLGYGKPTISADEAKTFWGCNFSNLILYQFDWGMYGYGGITMRATTSACKSFLFSYVDFDEDSDINVVNLSSDCDTLVFDMCSEIYPGGGSSDTKIFVTNSSFMNANSICYKTDPGAAELTINSWIYDDTLRSYDDFEIISHNSWWNTGANKIIVGAESSEFGGTGVVSWSTTPDCGDCLDPIEMADFVAGGSQFHWAEISVSPTTQRIWYRVIITLCDESVSTGCTFKGKPRQSDSNPPSNPYQ